jgi:hypothetical protein
MDQNDASNQRYLDRIAENDAQSSEMHERRLEITAELAPLFGEGQVMYAYLRGEPYAVAYLEGQSLLTSNPLLTVTKMVAAADPDVIRLPGRQATIYRGVAVVDQEAG